MWEDKNRYTLEVTIRYVLLEWMNSYFWENNMQWQAKEMVATRSRQISASRKVHEVFNQTENVKTVF